ncbi:MAG: lipocalin-like domain-containing protein [Candidatus Xenobia bacterium]
MARLAAFICILMAGWQIARPGYVYHFPADHGSHDTYKTEWWYYTGHLDASNGNEYGYELTFFRVGLAEGKHRSRWYPTQLYLTHFAISDAAHGRFRFWEKTNRAGLGAAGAASGTLHVWNEGWEAVGNGPIKLRAEADDVAIDLTLTSEKPPVIQGIDGISQKGPGESNASHYYSLTRLDTTGTLSGQTVHGVSWMDHEFGSSELSAGQVGWDWFAVQLDDDSDLMLYHMRRADGSLDPFSSGTYVDAKGHATHLGADAFTLKATATWTSPHSRATYPMAWQIAVPSQQLALSVSPLLQDQELNTTHSTGVTYWEGATHLSGTHHGQPVRGRGYTELTGYHGKLNL